MSAHCNDCGADMSFGFGENWQVMTCVPCDQRGALRACAAAAGNPDAAAGCREIIRIVGEALAGASPLPSESVGGESVG